MKSCKQCEHYKKINPGRTKDGFDVVMFCPKIKERFGDGYAFNVIVKCIDDFTPKKPVEKNCKECEHYKFYDGGTWIMKCHGPTNYNQRYNNTEIKKCPDFIPKKPVEKTCKTCCFSMAITGKPCLVADRACDGYKNAWQPIKPDKSKRSCRDCENSKYKEGALFCGSYNTYPSNISVTAKECSCFTPKKPVETENECKMCKGFGDKYVEGKMIPCPSCHPKKPVEKSCENCRLSREQEGGCPKIGTITCGTIGSFQAWQPIKPDKPKAEVPKEEKRAIAMEQRRLEYNAGIATVSVPLRSAEEERRIDKIIIDAINPDKPKAEVPEKENEAMEEEPRCRDCKDYCNLIRCSLRSLLDIMDIECFKSKLKTNPPNSKEKTMSRMKKLIRKYVMACTLYCTAVICIALNPWVCKLWGLIISQDFFNECAQPAAAKIILPWLFTVTSIVAVYLAIHVFNKATDFIFGKLEK